MQTSSFMELTLTVLGWQISNRLAELIVASGLIYLPLLFLFWRNWSQPARSQEAKAAAPVSMRRMEQDVAIVFVTIILAFLPAVTISISEVEYTIGGDRKAIGTSGDLPYEITDQTDIKVPVLWWLVHQASSGFTEMFVSAVHAFRSPSNVRALSLALDYTKFDDPNLVAELRQFDLDCYLPALSRAERTNGSKQPEWRGDTDVLLQANYYPSLNATRRVTSWNPPYDFSPGNEGPSCDTWWQDGPNGLLNRLHSHIESRTAPETDYGMLVLFGNASHARTEESVRKFLANKPPPNISGSTADPDDRDTLSLWANLAAAGSLLAYPLVKTGMYLVVSGLPMLQSLVLLCIYLALPIAVPFAALRPGLIVFFTAAIFAVKFMTALWALAQFIDESLISFMYGDGTGSGLQVGSGSTTDILLAIITSISYLGFPLVWLWLMASFTNTSVQGVNTLFAYSAGKLESAAAQGVSAAKSVASTAFSGSTKK